MSSVKKPAFPNLQITTKGGANTVDPSTLKLTKSFAFTSKKNVTTSIAEFSDPVSKTRLQTHSHPGMRGRSHQVPLGVPRSKGDQRAISPDSRKILSAMLKPPPKKTTQ